ncbi:hypothetical protein L484_016146 [Morus notabilis]|uniref:Uncharacterized protein n=1 Tax=Morus notabilis TaxID=981085 RepID=W9QWI7_9ROSA|nr:hypothetical protein L484_016146 [Morus notabilis]
MMLCLRGSQQRQEIFLLTKKLGIKELSNRNQQLLPTAAKTFMLVFSEPVEVSGLPKEIVHISAGYYHSGAVTGAPKAVSVPTKVQSLIGMTIKMAAFGSEHSIAVTDGGESLSWGGGEYGRLGHGHDLSTFGFFKNTSEYTPRLIKELEGIKKMAQFSYLEKGQQIKCTTTVFHQPERVQGPFLESTVSQDFLEMRGYIRSLVVGSIQQQFLGHGSDVDYIKPRMINFGENVRAVQVSCGFNHTGAILEHV